MLVALFVSSKIWAEIWQDPNTKVNYTYYPDDNTACVTAGTYSSPITAGSPKVEGDVTILSEITINGGTYKVTFILGRAFYNCRELISITIPEGITIIGDEAFYGCENLNSVYLPSSTEKISANSFWGTKWYEKYKNAAPDGLFYIESILIGYKGEMPTGKINIKNGTRLIAGRAFYSCSGITDVTIPSSVSSIGEAAFSRCTGLTDIIIPSSVTHIGQYAFSGCMKLGDVTLPSGPLTIEPFAFENCKSPLAVHISDLKEWLENCRNVGTLSYHLFLNGSEIKDMILPTNVRRIEKYALAGCKGLTSVSISSGVTGIGDNAFYGCTGLTSVSIPPSVITIGDDTFKGCTSLKAVHIADLDAWCRIQFDYGSRWISKESNPLYYAHHLYLNREEVKDLEITNGVAFDGHTAVGSYAFIGCEGLTSVTFSSNITDILPYAFYGCKGLKEIVFHNGITDIRGNTFNGCTNLRSITIGSSVANLAKEAFKGCENLEMITSLIREPFEILSSVFEGISKNATLYVPAGTKALYEVTEGWKNFKNIVEMEPEPYEVKDDQTVVVKELEPDETGKVEIPEKVEIDNVEYTVTEIAEDAFKGNTELTEVTIPRTVTTIGSGAFEGCTNLKAIYVLSPTPASLAAAVSSRAQHKVASTTVSQFEGIDFETCVLYVPFGSEQAYREAEGWKEFRHIVGVHGETDPMLTVTAKSYSREYGEENPEFEFTTEGATLDGEPVIECEATPASPVGTYNIIVKKGGVKNYNDTYVKGTLTITKAPLTVKVEDVEREQGKENPQFVLTYTGWKNNETESVLTKKPMATTTATKDSPAGVYDIVVNGGEAQNYTLSYVSGTLTVTVPSSINFTPPLSQGEGAWYDLQGRKIKGQSVKKGVYVVNGRKVVIK